MERRTALTGGLAAVAALGTVATGAGRAVAASPASGATDRQLVRDDGARLLSAQYELRTDDGA